MRRDSASQQNDNAREGNRTGADEADEDNGPNIAQIFANRLA